MKVKFSHIFVDHNANVVSLNGNVENPCTLRAISVDALMYPNEEEVKLGLAGQEKVRRHDLAVKIMNFGDEAILDENDCKILKETIGRRYIPCVVAQSYALLDGKDLPSYLGEKNAAK